MQAIIDWFSGADIFNWLKGAGSGVTHWLTSMAGDIASGIEAGIVGILGDIWDVIIGPVLVVIGAVIIIWTLGFAFRNQIMSVAITAAAAAA